MLYLETSVVEKALGQLEPFGPIQQPYPFPLCHYLLALDIRLSPPVQAHNLEALLAGRRNPCRTVSRPHNQIGTAEGRPVTNRPRVARLKSALRLSDGPERPGRCGRGILFLRSSRTQRRRFRFLFGPLEIVCRIRNRTPFNSSQFPSLRPERI